MWCGWLILAAGLGQTTQPATPGRALPPFTYTPPAATVTGQPPRPPTMAVVAPPGPALRVDGTQPAGRGRETVTLPAGTQPSATAGVAEALRKMGVGAIATSQPADQGLMLPALSGQDVEVTVTP